MSCKNVASVGLPATNNYETASKLPQVEAQSSNLIAPNLVSLDKVFDNIKNIEIPDNIKDILSTVQAQKHQTTHGNSSQTLGM